MKKWFLLIPLFAFSLFVLSFTSAQQIFYGSNNHTYISYGNNLYGFNSETGEIYFHYSDEAEIVTMDSIDWNHAGSDDLVVYSISTVMPRIKIIDGDSGKILTSFYTTEKSFVGKYLLDVNYLKVINSKIAFSSDQMLYTIEDGQVKRIKFFESSILSLEGDGGDIVAEITKYAGNTVISEKYFMDFNGNVIRKETSTLNQAESSFSSYGMQDSKCDSSYFSNDKNSALKIAGIDAISGKFYCKDNYVYYVNDSNFLLKRTLSSEVDTPLWTIPCTPVAVLGEIVACTSSFVIKNGKEIGASSSSSFATYYDGQKELIIQNSWPFNYKYGNLQGTLGYDGLKGISIRDISSSPDFNYDNDGNKEIFISFDDNQQNTIALVSFELTTQETKLITLKMTEQQFASRKSSLQSQVTSLNETLNRLKSEISQKSADLSTGNLTRDQINTLNNEITALSDEVNNATQELWRMQSRISNLKPSENIWGFDVCNGQLFATTQSGLYSFSSQGNISDSTLIDLVNIYPQYVSCANNDNLAIFSSDTFDLVKKDGTSISSKNLGNVTLRPFSQVARIRNGNRIYLLLQNYANNIYAQILDLDGKLLETRDLGSSLGGIPTISHGKMFVCSSGTSFKLDLIGEQSLHFEQELNAPNLYLACSQVSVEDCNNDSKDEFFLPFKQNGEFHKNCLKGGSSMEISSVPDEYGQVPSITFLSGRIKGGYIITTYSTGSGQENSIYYNPIVNGMQEPNFPYEVYNSTGERVLVSSDSIFLQDNKFVDFSGKELNGGSDLISDSNTKQGQTLIDFSSSGTKIIFVDGKFYDVINENNAILQLTSGQHTIKFFQYSSGYLIDEVKVETASPRSISIISGVVFIIAVLLIILLFKRKKI